MKLVIAAAFGNLGANILKAAIARGDEAVALDMK